MPLRYNPAKKKRVTPLKTGTLARKVWLGKTTSGEKDPCNEESERSQFSIQALGS